VKEKKAVADREEMDEVWQLAVRTDPLAIGEAGLIADRGEGPGAGT